MIELINGDLAKTLPNGIIVHGVNAQGVMGSGFAAQIKHLVYPTYSAVIPKASSPQMRNMSAAYLGMCIPVMVRGPKYGECWIVNAVTQQFYGNDGKQYVAYDAVRTAFHTVAKMAMRLDLPVHFPRIGSGLAGGSWDTVKKIITNELDSCGVKGFEWVREIEDK